MTGHAGLAHPTNGGYVCCLWTLGVPGLTAMKKKNEKFSQASRYRVRAADMEGEVGRLGRLGGF